MRFQQSSSAVSADDRAPINTSVPIYLQIDLSCRIKPSSFLLTRGDVPLAFYSLRLRRRTTRIPRTSNIPVINHLNIDLSYKSPDSIDRYVIDWDLGKSYGEFVCIIARILELDRINSKIQRKLNCTNLKFVLLKFPRMIVHNLWSLANWKLK